MANKLTTIIELSPNNNNFSPCGTDNILSGGALT